MINIYWYTKHQGGTEGFCRLYGCGHFTPSKKEKEENEMRRYCEISKLDSEKA